MATTSSGRRRPRSGWAELDPIGVGLELRAARDRLNLTIEEAADTTRIRPAHVAALEAEDFAALPDPVHARGLLRAYATFLGLDAIELLSALESRGRLELGPASIEPEARRPPPLRSLGPRLLGLVVAILCAAGLIFFAYSQYSAFVSAGASPTPPPSGGRGAGLGASPTFVPNPTATVLPTGSLTAPAAPTGVLVALSSPTPRPPAPTAVLAATATASIAATSTVAPTSTSRAAPAAPLELVVEARISADTRARVEIDGKLHFEGILAARDQRTWRGSTITLQVANAGAVEVIVNGRPAGKLGPAGQPISVTWSR